MNQPFPLDLYTGQQVKLGEQQAATLAGVEMYTLMLRAGQATYQTIGHEFPNAKRMLVIVGTGNNGGDGFVVAKLAKADGLNVSLYLYGDEVKISGDAHKAKQEWLDDGGTIESVQCIDWSQVDADILVDGLLGTGLSGEVRSPLQALIDQINASGIPVIAIDVPSGLCADTGRVLGSAIKAYHTVTFIGAKQGLATGQARSMVGELHFAGLGVDAEFRQHTEPSSQFIAQNEFTNVMSPRLATAHKGHNGRLLCVGGNQGYSGAIRLCATAAVRCGAGLNRTLCHPSTVLSLQVACPEVMTLGWEGSASALCEALEFADVIAIGPGLGRDDWARELYNAVCKSDKPTVLDADGLNLLAQSPTKNNFRVITPHPGEAARLLQCAVRDIERDRFNAVKALHKQYGGVVVIKGAGTLVFDGNTISICQAGNAGMATGGMGDVLTGVIAALIAQGVSLSDSAKYGVLMHSVAADQIAQQQGQIGMLASDVIEQSRKVLNQWIS